MLTVFASCFALSVTLGAPWFPRVLTCLLTFLYSGSDAPWLRFLNASSLLGCARLRVLEARILRWRNEELSLLPGLLVDRVDDPRYYLYSQAPVNRSRPLAPLRKLLSSFRASSMIVKNRCVCGDGCEYYWVGYAVERVIHYDAV